MLFGGSDFRGKIIAALFRICHRIGKCVKIVATGETVLLIIQKCFGLLLGDLVLNRQGVIMPASLVLFRLQSADKLHFLRCQRTATFARIVNLLAGQGGDDCILPIFFRQGAHTDISLLVRMAERNILAAGDSISDLLHEGKEASKVMWLFFQCLVNIKAEAVAIGELFNITLPAIVAHAVGLRIFDYRHSVLNANQVTKPSNCQRAAQKFRNLRVQSSVVEFQ